MSLKDVTFLCWAVILMLFAVIIAILVLAPGYYRAKRDHAIERQRIKRERQEAKEEERKRKFYNNSLSLDEFTDIANSCAKRFRRIRDVSIGFGTVTCFVESQSSKTVWRFTVYFTTNGSISSEYGIASEVSNSDIPQAFADMMSQKIYRRLGK